MECFQGVGWCTASVFYSVNKVLVGRAALRFPCHRFLTGTAPLNGVYATGMVDTWTAVASNKNDPGYTFSALDNRPVKRVSFAMVVHVLPTCLGPMQALIQLSVTCHKRGIAG